MAGPRNEQEESSQFSLKVNWLSRNGGGREKKKCPGREEELKEEERAEGERGKDQGEM